MLQTSIVPAPVDRPRQLQARRLSREPAPTVATESREGPAALARRPAGSSVDAMCPRDASPTTPPD